MNKKLKFICTLLLIGIMIQGIVLAGAPATPTVTTDDVEEIQTVIMRVLRTLSYFGYAIALGMLIFVGAKYTMSPANERADVKKGLTGYVFGTFLIAGASVIASIVSGVAAMGAGDSLESMADKILEAGGL